MSKEPPAKSSSHMVSSLIEEDVDMSRSATRGGYVTRRKEEGTSSKSLIRARKSKAKEKGDREEIVEAERRIVG